MASQIFSMKLEPCNSAQGVCFHCIINIKTVPVPWVLLQFREGDNFPHKNLNLKYQTLQSVFCVSNKTNCETKPGKLTIYPEQC